jgi:hypothetical protein
MYINKCYVSTVCTYEVLSPVDGIRNLFKFGELVDKGRECWRWIPNEARLSVDRELYHLVCVDGLVKRFC